MTVDDASAGGKLRGALVRQRGHAPRSARYAFRLSKAISHGCGPGDGYHGCG